MPKDHAGNEEELAQDRPTQATLLSLMYCHPNLGWLGSGYTHSGGISANSLHDGISRPAVTKDCTHACTLETWSRPVRHVGDHRLHSFTIRMQSTQLAQWAPPLERCALTNPNPPAERDKVEITLAKSGAAGVPNVVRMQIHTLSSWCSALVSDCSQPEIGPSGCTHEQQEPRRLRVIR